MAKPHQRAVALIFAILFFASSVGVSLFVIWQIYQEREANESLTSTSSSTELTDEQIQEAINQQQEQPVTKLQGTKLENYETAEDTTKLQAIDLVEGTGEVVEEGASVTAHYTGAYVSDGTIFQSSKDGGDPIQFSLDQVIPGWTQGVPGMKVGGTRRLIIPANLAYGEAPEGYTQGSSARPMGPLVFDIELTAVTNP